MIFSKNWRNIQDAYELRRNAESEGETSRIDAKVSKDEVIWFRSEISLYGRRSETHAYVPNTINLKLMQESAHAKDSLVAAQHNITNNIATNNTTS